MTCDVMYVVCTGCISLCVPINVCSTPMECVSACVCVCVSVCVCVCVCVCAHIALGYYTIAHMI